MKSRKRKNDECYLCGAQATTRDHTPPRGLFPEPLPNNLLTVPACSTCNQAGSLDDEYFRVVVAAISRDSPQSLALLRQRILPRTLERPALIVELLKSVRPVEIHSAGGIYLGHVPELTFDRPRIQTVIDKIVKGLFFRHTKRRLASDYVVGEFLYNPPLKRRWLDEIARLPLVTIGDGSVFSYRYDLADVAGSESYWFLMFYDDRSLFITDTSCASPEKHAGEVTGQSRV